MDRARRSGEFTMPDKKKSVKSKAKPVAKKKAAAPARKTPKAAPKAVKAPAKKAAQSTAKAKPAVKPAPVAAIKKPMLSRPGLPPLASRGDAACEQRAQAQAADGQGSRFSTRICC
jgi:hypothetical protein